MKLKYSISIVTYSAVDKAKKCVESVLKNSKHYELILTSNGNPEASQYFCEIQKHHPNVRVFENSTNKGFIEPNREAFSVVKTPYMVLLNDDTIVPDGWLQTMEAEFRKTPTAAIVGPRNTPCSIGQGLGGFVGKEVEYIEFSCAMLRTSIFKEIGLFPPQLIGAYCEDIHTSLHVRELGYTLHQADVEIQHERHATSRHVPEVQQWIANNTAFVQNRWSHYLKVRRFDYPIVLRSGDSLANPVMAVPVLKSIKASRPLSPLYLETESPESFVCNGVIEQASKHIAPMKDELRISLDDKPTMTTINGRALLAGDRIIKKNRPPTVTLLYVMVMNSIEFQKQAVEFVESYLKNPPGYDHKTMVVCNAAMVDERTRSFFRKMPEVEYLYHDNSGFDIGSYITGAKRCETDMMIVCGSNTYLTKPNWMKRFVEAWQKHGPGMYGAFASFEVLPHINTTLFAVAPDLLKRYPLKPVSKAERYSFEHGADAFWRMVYSDEYPVKLVTFDGEYDWKDWRKPQNIYRRGDQSNCLGGFRITKEYERATPQLKYIYEQYADTLSVKGFQP